ncbi:OLC1v1013001C1 [Oldenlandia corymbosa var. corymbosa]|uniref:OLC1v1013001C1 n=1 Tax=Oldenlandia corymbosa var. corymbosa TaxID=529605 RepID=A0AAV1E0E2_OLDCO|nr:OLC1v1013001C1 [Oldenlandia corymbosa var. corymbosa]
MLANNHSLKRSRVGESLIEQDVCASFEQPKGPIPPPKESFWDMLNRNRPHVEVVSDDEEGGELDDDVIVDFGKPIPDVQIKDELYATMVKSWENVVVFKVMGTKWWEDAVKVLVGGPWVVSKQYSKLYLHVQPWSDDVDETSDKITSVVAWIRLPGMPVCAYGHALMLCPECPMAAKGGKDIAREMAATNGDLELQTKNGNVTRSSSVQQKGGKGIVGDAMDGLATGMGMKENGPKPVEISNVSFGNSVTFVVQAQSTLDPLKHQAVHVLKSPILNNNNANQPEGVNLIWGDDMLLESKILPLNPLLSGVEPEIW